MYYGRKRKIMIIVSVAIAVLIVFIIGLMVLVKTDLFKSSETLFWKYASKAIPKETSILESSQYVGISKNKQTSPYSTTSEIIIDSSNEDAEYLLQDTIFKIEKQTDVNNDYNRINMDVVYKNETFFNAEYVESNDIFAIKSNEIVSAFLGVKNDDLDGLSEKLGVTISIPDEINNIDLLDVLSLNKEDKEYIIENYKQIIKNNVPSSCYGKDSGSVITVDGVSYTTNSYRFDLTEEQFKSLINSMLNYLKTDSITLNIISTKLKALGLEEKSSISYITQAIDQIINEVNETEIPAIAFIVYSYEGETISTSIIFKSQAKITISNNANNQTSIVIENLNAENEKFNTISIKTKNELSDSLTKIYYDVDIDDQVRITLNNTTTGNPSQDNVENEFDLVILYNGESLEIKANSTTNFSYEIEDMIELENGVNCALLNDYSKEQLNLLIQALSTQIITVYNNKLRSLGATSLVFEPGTNVGDDEYKDMKAQIVGTFNESFANLDGQNVRGTDIKLITDRVLLVNQTYKQFPVKVTLDEKDYQGDNINNVLDDVEENAIYNIELVEDEDGLISKVVLKKLEEN